MESGKGFVVFLVVLSLEREELTPCLPSNGDDNYGFQQTLHGSDDGGGYDGSNDTVSR